MSNPKGYVDSNYLRNMAAHLMADIKRRTYEMMHIQPGDYVLDVGCGPATDTIPLAELVGSQGQVVGVDYDADMITEAEKRTRAAGLDDRVRYERADVLAGLPFEIGLFDSVRSERLFQHLLEPAKALAEMARVTKSGSWIVVMDTDHSMKSFDTPETDVQWKLLRVAAERVHNNGYSGRQLYRLFKRQGLAEIVIEPLSICITNYALAREANVLDRVEQDALQAGIVTQGELDRWRASLEATDARGEFFFMGGGVLIAGKKPE